MTEKVFSSLTGLKEVELVLGRAKMSKSECKGIGTHIADNLANLEHLKLDFNPFEKPFEHLYPELPEDTPKDLLVPVISYCQKLEHLDLNFSG